MEKDWFRQALVSLLKEFSSVESNAPVEELANIWTNHLYVPGVAWAAYLPEIHAEVVAQFQSNFAPSELETLKEFNRCVIASGSASDDARQRQLASAARQALKTFLN